MVHAPVTIDDVTAAVGLSRRVVAEILSGGSGARVRFSPATKERVLATAHTMGYRPNRAARGLGRQRHNSVGIYVGRSVYSVPQSLLGALLVYSRIRKLLPVVELGSCRAPGPPICLTENCIDALLVFDYDDHFRDEEARLGIPVIRVNAGAIDQPNTIAWDEPLAARTAVQHLAERGFAPILHLHQISDHYSSAERQQGVRAAATSLGLPQPIEIAITRTPTETLTQALRDHPEIRGVFLEHESHAIPLYQAAVATGRRIGHDLGVVTLGMGDPATLHHYGLTNLQIDWWKLATHLLDQVETMLSTGQPLPAERIPFILYPAASTGGTV